MSMAMCRMAMCLWPCVGFWAIEASHPHLTECNAHNKSVRMCRASIACCSVLRHTASHCNRKVWSSVPGHLKHPYQCQGNRMRARRAPCVLMWRVFGRHLVLVLDKGANASEHQACMQHQACMLQVLQVHSHTHIL